MDVSHAILFLENADFVRITGLYFPAKFEFIRYVIPKGHTFKGYTQKDMTLVANHINSTIRPGLSYKSPYDLVKTEDMKKLLEILGMSPIPAEDICLSPKLLSK